MQAIIEFLNFLLPYGLYSYFVMFGVLIACGFGFPMPEDVILVTGGILSARGVCDFWMTNAVCMAGVLIGDGIVYFIGRRFGPEVKESRLFRRVLNEKVDAKISNIFAKYGDKVVFMGRFMPGLRMPIFLTAGIYRVSPFKFFGLDGFAAVVSVPAWIYVGYIFGDNFEVLGEKVRQVQFGVFGVLGAIILGIIIFLFTKKKIINKI